MTEFEAKTNDAAIENADRLLAKPKDYALAAKADYWNGAYDGFKAGAEWAMEQGVTIDGCVTAIANERWLDIDDDRADEVLSKFHNDEKVIVQIRKKDE